MKKILITIESNDSAVSNAVTLLLRQHAFACDYELEINPEYCFQYQEPIGKPYFTHSPVYCMNFYYHFIEHEGQTQLAQFRELETFASQYTPHIKQVMRDSAAFTERLQITENEAQMSLSHLGPALKMEAMKKKIASSQYNLNLFAPAREPTNSSPSSYLYGIGIVVALSALFISSTGLAIAIGVLGAIIFAAGLVYDAVASEQQRLNSLGV